MIEAIGGANGWYSLPVAWRIRGLIDRLLGGVGLRRGRRDPERLRVGDSLDFWRVEEIEPGRLLRLRAEMLLPGLAWLELSVSPQADPASPQADSASPQADSASPQADPAFPETGASAPRAGAARAVYRQRAVFHPHGLLGHAYWWGISPFHSLIFGRMPRNIARAATARAARDAAH
nr:hypothetical protein GCM10020093_023890 [Planobispora longispora]